MKILGIDPGLINTGYGIIEIKNKKINVIDYGIIQPSKKQPLSKRLRIIYDDTKLIIKKYNPTVCVVEEVFYSNNFKTSLLLGQARAAVLIASAKMSLKTAPHHRALIEKKHPRISSKKVGETSGKNQKIQQNENLNLTCETIVLRHRFKSRF